MARARLLRPIALALLACSAGCTSVTYELRAEPLTAVEDQSASSANLAQRSYRQVMVLPPSGSERGQFDTNLAVLERALLRRGLTMIAPAVSARVVFNEDQPSGAQRRGGSELSDLERILIMARESRANAVLQIGELGDQGAARRLFVATPGVAPLREVTPGEWNRAAPAWRWALEAPVLRFTARLIDVESGEIMASLAMQGRLVHALPETWVGRLRPHDEKELLVLVEESFPFTGSQEAEASWLGEARRAVTDQMFNRVAALLTGGEGAQATSPGGEPGAEPAGPGEAAAPGDGR